MSDSFRPPSRPYAVAVFAPAYPPAYLGGGPVRTLEALVDQAPGGLALRVVAPNKDLDGSDLDVRSDEWIVRDRSSVMFVSAHQLSGLARGLKCVRLAKPDAIYLNSFFDFRMAIVPQILARVGYWRSARVLLAPRGEFNRGALAIRRNKKRLFLALYRIAGLQRRVIWHASSEIEAEAVRTLWGSKARILIKEDETNLPQSASSSIPHDGPLRAVFLGRLVPIKGVLTALEALESEKNEVIFDVYGPEEDAEYVAACKDAARRVPANVTVTFHGSLGPNLVLETLQRSDVMIMPTQGENFGHVIAEALSVSCPVICSDETPWSAVLQSGGGTVVSSPRPADWLGAIDEYASASPRDRERRREDAGMAYDAWKSGIKGDHVLVMLAQLPS